AIASPRPVCRGCRHPSSRAAPPARLARFPRLPAAPTLSGDKILAMIQAPDIGKVIFEHTSDSHVVELPFGLGEWHLPTGWYVFGVDLSPTKHVVFMVLAAVLVFLTVWYAGRQVQRRQQEGKAPGGFGAAIEAIVLFIRDDVVIGT